MIKIIQRWRGTVAGDAGMSTVEYATVDLVIP
jgi:hypothetical protein